MFEPQLPYMYVPQDDFSLIRKAIFKIYRDYFGVKKGLSCNDLGGYCYFTRPCNRVNKPTHSDIQIHLYENDKDVTVLSLATFEHTLIPGSKVGTNDKECFIPIFAHKRKEKKHTWYLGNLFMKKYYTVFDMTPYDKFSKDYLHVGIGPRSIIGIKPDYDHHNIPETKTEDPYETRKETDIVIPTSNPNNHEKLEPYKILWFYGSILVIISVLVLYYFCVTR